ncbi:kinase-like domain-containing protein [Choanephora cucurbitarum]|nr:kinase-like domain-containing protein [Choanephora cucurbitarum]
MSSESFYNQELPPLTRSTTTHGRHHSSPHVYYATPNKLKPEWAASSAKGIPSFVNLLTDNEQDWFNHKDYTASRSSDLDGSCSSSSKHSYRRTFRSTSPVKKSSIALKKSHSPPPPLPPQVPEKRFIMPFMHKIKRKLSLGSSNYTNAHPKPRRSSTISSTNGLADYQGYANQKKHRSFTYSPPPPPRTSSLAASSVPAVPPLPAVPKLQQMNTRSSSLKQNIAPVRKSSLKKPSNQVNLSRKLSTAEYAKNISHDLALIEKDIRALEIQRDRHSSLLVAAENKAKLLQLKDNSKGSSRKSEDKQAVIGRKRGKTLPGSLATPPPSLTLNLPPMTLNPIQLTIPTNIQSKKPTPRQSTSTTTHSINQQNRLKLSALTDQAASDSFFKSSKISTSDPALHKKNPIPTTHSHPTNSNQSSIQSNYSSSSSSNQHNDSIEALYAKTASLSVEPSKERGATRSPKSVQTSLKYYSQYLSDYERQIEIHNYNEIYFVGPHAQTKHGTCTSELNYGFDEHGNYKIVIQDHLAYRYEMLDLLGRGSFGQVVKCYDHKTGNRVAIKLIRNKKRFHAQGLTEINILKKLIEWDSEDQHHTIRMVDYFHFRNHLCIAFECLSMNLYEFIKSNHFRGFSLQLIQKMTIQILQSLSMLANHDVIHCDLKPENIMLKHPAKSAIKSQKSYPWSLYHKSIDMWSVGCIAAELYTGMPLFPGENEQEQLSGIMEVMGLPDKYLIEHVLGQPRIVPNSKGKKRIPGSRPLRQALKCNDEVFISFVEQCLSWDPSKRLTPQEALKHDWIVGRRHTSNSSSSVYSRLARPSFR